MRGGESKTKPKPKHSNGRDGRSCRSAVRRRKGKGLRPALRAPLPRPPGRGVRDVFETQRRAPMMDDQRLFRRTDPDFPTTRAAQARLVAAGRVAGEGPLRHGPDHRPGVATRDGGAAVSLPVPDGPSIPLGETEHGTLHLDLNRLLAGRCLIQGSSGAGKSATLRHIIGKTACPLSV